MKQYAEKCEIPKTAKLFQFPTQLRYELPFPLQLPNLIYLDRLISEQWHISLHYHDFFEISYIVEGAGWFTVNDFLYRVDAGEMLITKPGEIHSGRFPEGMTMLSCGLTFEQMRELEIGFYRSVTQPVIRDRDDRCRAGLTDMIEELQRGEPYASIMVRNKLSEMLVGILRSGGQQSDRETTEYNADAIKYVLQSILTESFDEITAHKLARNANMSRSHLDREFKRYMGVSLWEYVRLVRLDRAKQELRETGKSITAIAEKLHFGSTQAFCMFFKRHIGLYPQEYRNSISCESLHTESERRE